MPDVFLYQGEASPKDVKLRDPTVAGGAGPTAYTLTCLNGAYAITGSSANLLFNRIVIATSGSYAITGNNQGLIATRLLNLTAGAYAITGNSSNTLFNRRSIATAGSYSLTGNNANTLSNKIMTAIAGAYSITGNNADLNYSAGVADETNRSPLMLVNFGRMMNKQ